MVGLAGSLCLVSLPLYDFGSFFMVVVMDSRWWWWWCAVGMVATVFFFFFFYMGFYFGMGIDYGGGGWF